MIQAVTFLLAKHVNGGVPLNLDWLSNRELARLNTDLVRVKRILNTQVFFMDNQVYSIQPGGIKDVEVSPLTAIALTLMKESLKNVSNIEASFDVNDDQHLLAWSRGNIYDFYRWILNFPSSELPKVCEDMLKTIQALDSSVSNLKNPKTNTLKILSKLEDIDFYNSFFSQKYSEYYLDVLPPITLDSWNKMQGELSLIHLDWKPPIEIVNIFSESLTERRIELSIDPEIQNFLTYVASRE